LRGSFGFRADGGKIRLGGSGLMRSYLVLSFQLFEVGVGNDAVVVELATAVEFKRGLLEAACLAASNPAASSVCR